MKKLQILLEEVGEAMIAKNIKVAQKKLVEALEASRSINEDIDSLNQVYVILCNSIDNALKTLTDVAQIDNARSPCRISYNNAAKSNHEISRKIGRIQAILGIEK